MNLVVMLPQSLDILENQEFYFLDKYGIIRLVPRSVNLYKDAEEGAYYQGDAFA